MEVNEKVHWKAEHAIGGNTRALQALREHIIYPHVYSREARKLGLKWPRGLLLHGPPGTGKTSLVHAVARECNAHMTLISPHSLLGGYAGESEKFLREAFSEAYTHVSSGKPSIIFIDEIDVIGPPRECRREQESRVLAQLLILMHGHKKSPPSNSFSHVAVVAATNRVHGIDPALRRSGRFDVEIEFTTPTEEERIQILKLYTKDLSLDPFVSLKSVAASCNGYVGADLEALCREACTSARRSPIKTDGGVVHISMDDWKYARSVVGPSITRGVTVEVPKVSWDDIGGLKDLKKKLQQAVEWPIKYSESFAKLGISPIRGVLLHGPPGCSKTTLAKAAAHAAEAAFFSLSGADMFSMYVGEGEALIRSIFQRARLAAPSVIFFDEADVVASKRSGSANSRSNTTVGERLLSTLLTEMDGLEQAKGILVLAATNRPHAIDAALMRPGRFDLVLYVPPPDLEGREEILRVHTRYMKLGEEVDLKSLAADTQLFTGAELAGLCVEAGMVALREDISAMAVLNRHFWAARNSLRPALTESLLEEYSSFTKKMPSK